MLVLLLVELVLVPPWALRSEVARWLVRLVPALCCCSLLLLVLLVLLGPLLLELLLVLLLVGLVLVPPWALRSEAAR